ncbi:RagB/SusD family nutrient uptake outer membrane protein [Pedobacter aquatilis]|uniref:RagB/SusD family nutrient uptake outer membrane protein n=1 Tax=Pedobacter aquatilis TaxID=351343 RepID=UPI00292F45B1|nr:RagB/SusD family nutrient uptake outer membrane protein [Pedobacter aquatilis]
MKKIYSILSVLIISSQFSCKKLLEIPPPQTSLSAEAVFSSNETAISAMTQLYAQASSSNITQASFLGLSGIPGLSSDELLNFRGAGSTGQHLTNYNRNTLSAIASTSSAHQFWVDLYGKYIYRSNRIIEGLQAQKSSEEDPSSRLSAAVKRQLMGEALFIRAFSYFYLIQMYGDVPLLTTSNYETNSTAGRTNKDFVYQQIVRDLKEAENNLSNSYVEADVITSHGDTPRIRPVKWAAKALLARVYLYIGNSDADAERESKAVIGNTNLYGLSNLGEIFKAGSFEAIWQLQPVSLGWNTQEARAFIIPTSGPSPDNYPFRINPLLLSAFESGDKRRTSWINTRVIGTTTYYYPYKYKIANLNAAVEEYSTVLRLAEQYLICSEALAKQNKISEAQVMLNAVRHRAGLSDTPADTKEKLLDAILAERRVELFSEFGHRWFDLKRTGKVDEVMRIAMPLKDGGEWQPYQAYYPIMPTQLNLNQNVAQTPGY